MAKRRCRHCKQYSNKSEMIIVGLYAFCSEEHRQAHAADATKRTTSSKIPEKIRREVSEADSYVCRLCGENKGDLVLHHVVYRSESSDDAFLHSRWNLISLCNYPCHLVTVHGNKKKFKALCLQIIWLREVKGDRTTTIQDLLEEYDG